MSTRVYEKIVDNHDLSQPKLCRLCGETSRACVELSQLSSFLSPSFISRHMGIKLKAKTSCLICKQCIEKIKQWKEFVQSCVQAQPQFDSSAAVPTRQQENNTKEESSSLSKLPVPPEPDICNNSSDESRDEESQSRKSKFTIEYLTEKLGRKLKADETEKLTTFIERGDDRAIYAFLFGSGSNQSWQCQLCTVIIKGTMKQVAKHYSNSHQADPLYPCQLCGKVIKSSHTYKRHRTAHLAEYKCSSCDKVFQDRSKLLAHQVAHSNNRPHECSECGKQYKLASHLKAHMSRAHLPESDRLAFTCEICGKRFASKGNLTTHVQTTHSDSRPFVCELCGKGVKSKQALQFHMNSHNGLKQFTCHICSLSFTSRSSMASHVRRHTGERPYPCKQCGKTFTSSSARSSHRLHVHATSREHACPHCTKSFKVLRDLKVHVSIHTGEKPYVCDCCGKAFRVAANFYAHRKKHHKTSTKPSEETAQAENDQDAGLNAIRPAVNDALSQAIQQHLSDSGLVLDDAPLSSFSDNPQGAIVIYNHALSVSDGLDYAVMHSEQHPPTSGFLKEIIMAQFEDKMHVK